LTYLLLLLAQTVQNFSLKPELLGVFEEGGGGFSPGF